MNRQVYMTALLSLTLSACSSVSNKRAAGSFEYADREEAPKIVVPEGLHKPKQYKDYDIAKDVNHDGPVGKNVDVRAPSLVLPVAASSRIDPKSQEAFIWFDQVIEERNLTDFIVRAVHEQLESDGVGLRVIDEDKYVYESDWYRNEEEKGYWGFEKLVLVDSLRFRYTISPKPHGRSVSLAVEMVEYKHDKNSEQKIDIIDKHRAEMQMLNEVVAQVDYQYRLVQRENQLLRANQKLLSIGENEVGEPSYIIEMESDLVWQNLPLFFEDYGFTIADLNETKKIYYVDFTKPENNFWDTIWGDEVPVIDVADARYQFVLEAREDSTVLTIYNSDGEALPVATLERIFPVMEPGLSFRNIY